VRLSDCPGWGRPIYAAAPGTVVKAEDGWPERDPVNLARDVAVMLKNSLTYDPKHPLDYHSLAGNYVIVETDGMFAVYAHCQNGSITVAVGEKIETGRRLAKVGHSGNSTAPHLHFQLMDNPDPWQAAGLPCCFREYEVFEDGAWRRARNEIPKSTDRIRNQ
jgi:murein DD-endopeptidase MepM/ murein hydrolase activator NlpD